MVVRHGSKRGKVPIDAGFSPKDDAVALALAEGMTRVEASKATGISERTCYARLQDPAFRALIVKHRDAIVAASVGKLAAAGAKAVVKLVALLDDESSSVQLQAARSLLELTVKLGSYNEIVERLAALESRVETKLGIHRG